MKYVGAIDQGTTSTRFMIFDEEGSVVASSQLEHKQIYPKPGWVEHDADEIWDNTCSVIRDCLRKAELNGSDLSAIGITNQRETIVPYDKATARPLYNAIVWQDLRGEAYISKLKEILPEDELRRKTGLLYSPYFSASKIRWLLDNVPAIRKGADDGSIVFGTIDSYLTARLTSGKEAETARIAGVKDALLFDLTSPLPLKAKKPSAKKKPKTAETAGARGAQGTAPSRQAVMSCCMSRVPTPFPACPAVT